MNKFSKNKSDKLRGGERQIVEILWTGGFDSTFRIIQLSRCDVAIQPYYMSDNRKSEENELNAIKSITESLKAHESTRCIFLDLIIVGVEDRQNDPVIQKAWAELRKTDFFGSQYEWLASFASNHKGIELSIHEDDKAVILIKKYGNLKKCTDPVLGDYEMIDREKSNKNIEILFGNYHLPLVSWTKLQMKEFYEKNNYSHIMDMTWFCR